jgi:hypothetical protein
MLQTVMRQARAAVAAAAGMLHLLPAATILLLNHHRRRRIQVDRDHMRVVMSRRIRCRNRMPACQNVCVTIGGT